jgi:hypothetical protein
MREIDVKPHTPVYFTAIGAEFGDEFIPAMMQYDYTIDYMFDHNTLNWRPFITIDPWDHPLHSTLDWITICQATANNFNFAMGHAVLPASTFKDDYNASMNRIMDEMYVCVKGHSERMHVRLFLGKQAEYIITEPSFPEDPMEEDDLLSDETLSQSSEFDEEDSLDSLENV